MGSVILALILVGALAAIIVMLFRSMKFQPEGSVGVIETFGRFSRVVLPGRYFLWPWDTYRKEVPLQLFDYETGEQTLLTKSGQPVMLTMVVFYQLAHVSKPDDLMRVLGTTPPPRGSHLVPGMVLTARTMAAGPVSAAAARQRAMGTPVGTPIGVPSGPLAPEPNMFSRLLGRRNFQEVEHAAYRATYIVSDWQHLTKKESVDTLHQVFARLDIGKDLIGNDNWQTEIAERIRTHLNEKTARWGVEVHEIDFKGVRFSEQTILSMTAEMRAEREARQRRLEAKTQKEIADLLGLDVNTLLQWRYIDAMRELSKNSQARIMLSTNMSGAGGAMPMPMMEEQNTPATSTIGGLPAFPPPNPQLAPPPGYMAPAPGAISPAAAEDRDQQ
jgi:regulator of protease activity HflC (stomatin/prohibitin superfamily)